MIGKIRKSMKKKETESPKPKESETEENKSAGKEAKQSKISSGGRQSVLGAILEESFARVREDIQSIRDAQESQSEELRGLASSVAALTEKHEEIASSGQTTDEFDQELGQVKDAIEEIRKSHDDLFSEHIKGLSLEVEKVKDDLSKHSERVVSHDDIQAKIEEVMGKDIVAKGDVEDKLSTINGEVERLATRIQEREESLRKDLMELKSEARPGDAESLNKLFEDLNELDNEIIDLKRELNKERKAHLDVRKELDELFSAVAELKEMEEALLQHNGLITDLQRLVGTEFKNKYY